MLIEGPTEGPMAPVVGDGDYWGCSSARVKVQDEALSVDDRT